MNENTTKRIVLSHSFNHTTGKREVTGHVVTTPIVEQPKPVHEPRRTGNHDRTHGINPTVLKFGLGLASLALAAEAAHVFTQSDSANSSTSVIEKGGVHLTAAEQNKLDLLKNITRFDGKITIKSGANIHAEPFLDTGSSNKSSAQVVGKDGLAIIDPIFFNNDGPKGDSLWGVAVPKNTGPITSEKDFVDNAVFFDADALMQQNLLSGMPPINELVSVSLNAQGHIVNTGNQLLALPVAK